MCSVRAWLASDTTPYNGSTGFAKYKLFHTGRQRNANFLRMRYQSVFRGHSLRSVPVQFELALMRALVCNGGETHGSAISSSGRQYAISIEPPLRLRVMATASVKTLTPFFPHLHAPLGLRSLRFRRVSALSGSLQSPLFTLLNMGRVFSAESYPHPPVKVITQTRAEPFD